MIVLSREIGGRVGQVGLKIQQIRKGRYGVFHDFKSDSQGLTDGKLDRLIGNDHAAVKMGRDSDHVSMPSFES
jgi:hypothetical protein